MGTSASTMVEQKKHVNEGELLEAKSLANDQPKMNKLFYEIAKSINRDKITCKSTISLDNLLAYFKDHPDPQLSKFHANQTVTIEAHRHVVHSMKTHKSKGGKKPYDDSNIGISQFRSLMATMFLFTHIWDIFEVLDKDVSDLRLTKAEFTEGKKEMSTVHGLEFLDDIPDEDWNGAFTSIDEDGNGFITFEEFCKYVVNTVVKPEHYLFNAAHVPEDIFQKYEYESAREQVFKKEIEEAEEKAKAKELFRAEAKAAKTAKANAKAKAKAKVKELADAEATAKAAAEAAAEAEAEAKELAEELAEAVKVNVNEMDEWHLDPVMEERGRLSSLDSNHDDSLKTDMEFSDKITPIEIEIEEPVTRRPSRPKTPQSPKSPLSARSQHSCKEVFVGLESEMHKLLRTIHRDKSFQNWKHKPEVNKNLGRAVSMKTPNSFDPMDSDTD